MSHSIRQLALVRRALVPLVVATCLVLATAGGVLGKCQHNPEEVCPAGVVATFDPGGSVTAGSTETVGVWIHDGEVPYAADHVAIVFSSVGDGTVLRVDATPTSLIGRWEATVELPAGGTWALAADIAGPDFAGSLTLDPIQVQPPPAAPPAGAPSAIPGLPVLPWVALAAIATLAAALGGGIVARNRRREASAQG